MTATSATHAPVFVVGYMHSGTTLLYNILGRHSEVLSSFGESKFFEFLPLVRKRFGDLRDPKVLRGFVEHTVQDLLAGGRMASVREGRPEFEEAALRRRDALAQLSEAELDAITQAAGGMREHGQVFRAVFDRLTRRAGRTRWMEKTPTHVFHIAEILRTIPDARFVEITRDPRDVLASKKTRRASVWTSARYTEERRAVKDLEKAFDPLWDTLSWKSAVTAGRKARESVPDRIRLVRYEDLVADPAHTIEEVCEFLDLKFEQAMLDVTTRNTADWDGRSARSGIYQASVGRWQTILSPAEIALCERVVRSELRALGYPDAPGDLRGDIEAAALVARSGSELMSRLVRRWRLGGPAYFGHVVTDYARRLRVLVGR